MSESTSLIVNGEQVTVEADPETPLLSVLRHDLGLTGTRTGCGIGECGSCTVIVDGAPVRSCLTPVSAVADTAVVTPEGLGTPESPHPVQQIFLDEQAAQCGYCINGVIMTTAALRERGVSDQDSVSAALSEHLCRCGVYPRIRRACERVLRGRDDTERAPAWSVQPLVPERGSVAGPSTAVDSGSGTEGASDAGADGPQHGGAFPGLPEGATVDRWLRLTSDGRVEVLAGKVELGQGIRTAFGQVVASQLGVPLELVTVRSSSTAYAPDEGYTAGSKSLESSGTAMAAAAVALRRVLLSRAADVLGARPGSVRFDDGGSVGDATHGWVGLAELAALGPVTEPVLAEDRPDWTAALLGAPMARDDLVPKLTGSPAYVHDLTFSGMVYARALLPPSYYATPTSVPLDQVRDMPGVLQVSVDGGLIIVVADRDDRAVRAVRRLSRLVGWDDPGIGDQGWEALPDGLRELPAERYVERLDEPENDTDSASSGDPGLVGSSHQATYRQPYQAHASIAPSCAVAEYDGAVTRVWTHSQGVHPLRRELAVLFGAEPDAIEVNHADGPGCYGQNLADDAAAFAVAAARTVPGRPVRFQFSAEDEFTWEPYGTAMLADLSAVLDDAGTVLRWRHHTLTDLHPNRPRGTGRSLMVGWLRADAVEPFRPAGGLGGGHNSVPPYTVGALDVAVDYVRGPLRVASLRSLGAPLNVFASESFVDELASMTKVDPLEFRLARLDDPRMRRVLQVAAEAIGWQPHVTPSGQGLGIAIAHYGGRSAIVAQAVRLSVDVDVGTISIDHVVTACYAGTVVNADGLVNQLEGGTVQALSRTLHEQVRFDKHGIESRDWGTYPVLRFPDVPPIDTIIVSDPGAAPLGAGEAALPPVPAAVANAVDDAVGIRLRDLPITAASLRRRLVEMDENEAERVLL